MPECNPTQALKTPAPYLMRVLTLLCAFCLVPALTALTSPDLFGQVLLRNASDTKAKQHSRVTYSVSDGNNVFMAGISSTDCAFQQFLMRLDATGNVLWKNDQESWKYTRCVSLTVLDGKVYRISTFESDRNDEGRRTNYQISRFDAISGKEDWVRNLEDVYVSAEGMLLSPPAMSRTSAPDVQNLAGNRLLVNIVAGDRRFLITLNKRNGEPTEVLFGGENTIGTGGYALDRQDNIYFIMVGSVFKAQSPADKYLEIEWDKSIEGFNTLSQAQDIFVGATNRLYVIFSNLQVVELDVDSGALLTPIDDTNFDTPAQLADSYLDWPFLYCAWNQAKGNDNREVFDFQVSKHDLNTGEIVWHERTAWPLSSARITHMAAGPDNSLMLFGIYESLESEEYAFQFQAIDQSDGVQLSENRHPLTQASTREYLHPNVPAHSTSDGAMLIGESSGDHEGARFISLRNMHTNGEFDAPVNFYGTFDVGAYVRETHPNAEGILELCFENTKAVVVQRDHNYKELWRSELPDNQLRNDPLTMQVNESGQIGIISAPSNSSQNAGVDAWRDLYEIEYLEDSQPWHYAKQYVNFYILDSQGQLLYSDSLQNVLTFVGIDLKSIGQDFYSAGLRQYPLGLHKNPDYYNTWIRFGVNSPLQEFDWPREPDSGAQTGPARLISWNNNLYGLVNIITENREHNLVKIDPTDGTQTKVLDLTAKDYGLSLVWQDGQHLLVSSRYIGDSPDDNFGGNIRMLNLEDDTIEWSAELEDLSDFNGVYFTASDFMYSFGRIEEQINNVNVQHYRLSKWDKRNGDLIWQKFIEADAQSRQKFTPQTITINPVSETILVGGLFTDTQSVNSADAFLHEFNSLNGESLGRKTIEGGTYTRLQFSSLENLGTLLYASSRSDTICRGYSETFLIANAVNVAEQLEVRRLQELNISPNPAETTCTLDFPGLAGEFYNITVYDLRGSSVLQHKMRLLNVESGLTLDVTGFNTGSYIVTVSEAGSGNGANFSGSLLIPGP